MTPDSDAARDILEDESSRLKDSLKSCRAVVANYRAMLTESSNDNLVDDVAEDDPEIGW